MTTRSQLYENTLREKGLPKDIINVIGTYIPPFESIRNEFARIIRRMYQNIFPSEFIDTNKIFDVTIQRLYGLLRKFSLREYLYDNFWRLYYIRTNNFIKIALIDEFKIRLYEIFDVKGWGLQVSDFTLIQIKNDFDRLMDLLINGLFDNNNLPLYITFDEYRKLFSVDPYLQDPKYWSYNNLEKALSKINISPYIVTNSMDRYNEILKHHDNMLSLLY